MSSQSSSHNPHNVLSAAGVLVTIGIIFGDIGTSPLYVLKAIIGNRPISETLILGGLSCVFWTLTLQTTIKYVLITLRADNNGEGGIFSLFTLVREKKKWLIIPAWIGGAALLADGIITPPISVSSAIEGLRYFNPNIPTVPIVIAILFVLFVIQQFGTNVVGKAFGPVMLVWFSMLGVFGFISFIKFPQIISAINPYYAYKLLAIYPDGFWLLGAVFLCTTGAEALYSDMGHCGRVNIRVSWIFVKTMLLINYFGQGASVLYGKGFVVGVNPFFQIIPKWFMFPAVMIATAAAIVASQALISGSFTLINEAIRLNFWPKFKINYPSNQKGQLYIPAINWGLFIGCVFVVLYFRESSAMESAYGLSIVLCMFSTTILLYFYLLKAKWNKFISIPLTLTFMIVEVAFLLANLEKFPHGGYVTLIIGSSLIFVMYVTYESKLIKQGLEKYVNIHDSGKMLVELSKDQSVAKYATHLVYMTSAASVDEVEEKIMYSILQKRPKRADLYWFIHVNVLDQPFEASYKVTHHFEDDVIRVDFNLGFRVEPRINLFFKDVVEDMVARKEIDIYSRYVSLHKNNYVGDFRFVIIEKYLSNDNLLPFFSKLVLNTHFLLQKFALSEGREFGLDAGNVKIEKFPLIVPNKTKSIVLKRILD